MVEFQQFFVKLNSTDFAEAPIFFYGITILEITLYLLLNCFIPFVCLAILKTGVMHRNFRVKLCCIYFYFIVQIYCRFILVYFELNDLPKTKSDTFLFWVETTRDAMIGYLSGVSASFAFERFIATNYWSWYERGKTSTLWVLLFTELFNLIPAFVISYLAYTAYISITVNYVIFGFIMTGGVIVFVGTYLINLRSLKNMSRGAEIDSYSVARTFQVQENVELMTYMCKLALPSAIASSIAVAGIGFNLFAPTEWRFYRNVAYCFFDLGIAITGVTSTLFAVVGNDRIGNEFKKMYPLSVFFSAVHIRTDNVSSKVEAEAYFMQLRTSWA